MTVERSVASFGEYEFACGGSIPDLRVAYESYGEFDGDNAVLLCHALTTGQRVADPGSGGDPGADPTGGPGDPDDRSGESEDPDDRSRPFPAPGTSREPEPWWDDVVGPGKPVDTEQYYVVCANAPGSCYGSSGPTSVDPGTGEPYGAAFPATRIEDWTDTQRLLLDRLGVDRLHAVVGGSIGGLNVLDWAKRYPTDVDRAVPIAATPRPGAQSLAFDALARRAITSDPDWRGGDYYGRDCPDRGLMLARQLGLIRYLSKDTFERRFGTEPTDREVRRPFPGDPYAAEAPYRTVESFLDYQGSDFVDRFDANSYLAVLRAYDEFDLARGYASHADALAAFAGEALVLSFTGDWYAPVAKSRTIESAFRRADVPVVHRVVESPYGHDAFLARPELVGPALRAFLADGITGVAGAERVADPAGRTNSG